MSDPKYKDIGEPEDRVVEELAEVVKECMSLMQELCKARRFGYFNFHPAEPEKLNIDRIKAEMGDCVEAFERLEVKMRDLSHKYWEAKNAEEKNIEPPSGKEEKTMEKPTEQSEVGLDVLVILQRSLDTLRDMTKVQCSNGNWNYDPYMHGMANGMIFALSLFDNKPPEYLEAPETWLKDLPNDKEPVLSEAI